MRAFRTAAALLALGLGLRAGAEVFTLWPWRNRSGQRWAAATELPGYTPLHSENIEVNGVRLRLETGRCPAGLAGLAEFLKSRFAPENLAVAPDTIRLTFQRPDGWIERRLLIDSGPGAPVTVFAVAAPERLPHPTWPAELPPPPDGATPVQVIRFAGRDAVYGAFRGASGSRRNVFTSLDAALAGRGWRAVSGESRLPDGGSGDLYLDADGRRLMWVTAGEDGSGACYLRPLAATP